jgi:rubrerythrin
MNADTRALLEDILRRESRSLLQYVSESFPWTTADEQQALSRLQEMVREECQATGALAQFFAKREHTFPYLGSFPAAFTTINFVSLDHVAPLLADAERQGLERLERDLGKLNDPEARDQVAHIVEMKRRHLSTLKTLIAPNSRATSPVS